MSAEPEPFTTPAPLVPPGECRDVCFNASEMAVYLGLNVEHLENLRRLGKIPSMNLGHRTKRYHLPTVIKHLHGGGRTER
jgi:hypothetical protein